MRISLDGVPTLRCVRANFAVGLNPGLADIEAWFMNECASIGAGRAGGFGVFVTTWATGFDVAAVVA
jgi:hypothetical protein